ncbi:MAG: zinc-ribbon domain-containing protein [Pyrinomonadaceae bacterium]
MMLTTSSTISVEEACGRCGADIRPDSLFCYNCGAQVASAAPVDTAAAELAEVKRPGSSTPRQMQSAAALKRTRPPRSKRTFEIVWEPAPAEPAGAFVAATVISAAFVLLIVILAFYLR